MRSYLNNGYKLHNADKSTYTICKKMGEGASCVAYYAMDDKSGSKCIVKEYYPLDMFLERNKSGEIKCSENTREKYIKGISRFEESVDRQIRIRNSNKIMNQVFYVLDRFTANNTYYVVVPMSDGHNYSLDNSLGICDRMRICKSVAEYVQKCHEEGYLCLDIKPSNIFVIPQTPELTLFFDFDSVCTRDEVLNGKTISYTENWAAPEQVVSGLYKEISMATDVYILGELIFWSVFERHSKESEHRRDSFFDYDECIEKYSELGRSSVQKILSDIFNKTIRSASKNRLASIDKLIVLLENLIKELSQDEYIKDTIIPYKDFFIGREKEVEEIYNVLCLHRCIFVQGVMGIGKTEVVKRYLSKYKKKYNNVLWITLRSTLEEAIADDVAISICGLKRNREESDKDYAIRKIERMRVLLKDENLLVIDNANSIIDIVASEIWLLLKGLNIKILVTTRCLVEDYPVVRIGEFQDKDCLKAIFKNYVQTLDQNEEAVEGIIDYLGCHTLLVELIAKQTRAIYYSPEKMLDELRRGGLSTFDNSSISLRKDTKDVDDKITAHIMRTFSLEKMSDKQKYILLSTAFMPIEGVTVQDFCALWDVNISDVRWLEKHGWIQIVKADEYYVSGHPAIAFAIVEQFKCMDTELDLFLLSLPSVLRQGYDDDSIRERYWGEYKNRLIQDGLPSDVIEYAQKKSLTRVNISFSTYVWLCDYVAKKVVEYKLSSRYALYFVKEYCTLFIKYGNIGGKLALMQFFIENEKNVLGLVAWEGIYADLLIEGNCEKEAVKFCKEQLSACSSSTEKQLIWYIRLAKANYLLHDMRQYQINYGMSRGLFWVIKLVFKRVENDGEYSQSLKNVLDESTPYLADLLEINSAGIVYTKNIKKQERKKIKYLEKAITYRGRVTDGVFRPTDNYLKLKYDRAMVRLKQGDFSGAKAILWEIIREYDSKQYVEITSIIPVYELLSVTMIELDEYKAAEEILIKALEISEKQVVSDDYMLRFGLGQLYMDTNRINEAEKIFRALVNDMKCMSCESNRLLAEAYYNVAEIELINKNLAAAEEYFLEAAKHFAKLASGYSLCQCVCYEKIADIKHEIGEYSGAALYMKNAIAILKKDRANRPHVPKVYKEKLKKYTKMCFDVRK